MAKRSRPGTNGKYQARPIPFLGRSRTKTQPRLVQFQSPVQPSGHLDIQNQVEYYRRKTGDNQLGIRFAKTVKAALKGLKSSAGSIGNEVRQKDRTY
jgi:hypothetical protein